LALEANQLTLLITVVGAQFIPFVGEILRLPRDSLLSRRSPAKEDGEGGWICISAIRMEFTRRGGQAPAETFKEKNLQK
jgi:hypothetical protein